MIERYDAIVIGTGQAGPALAVRLGASGRKTAILEPESGFIDDPMLAARNLAYAAQQHGARFRFHQEVVSVDRVGGHVSGVTLAGGEHIAASVVVNVGGPHSGLINKLAGVTARSLDKVGSIKTKGGPAGIRTAEK